MSKVNNELAELVKDIRNGVGKGSKFAAKELPELAKEVVAKARVSAVLYMLSGLLSLVVGTVLVLVCIHNIHDDFGKYVAPILTGVIFGLGFLISFNEGLWSFLELKVAPKLYVAKEIRNLIKGE